MTKKITFLVVGLLISFMAVHAQTWMEMKKVLPTPYLNSAGAEFGKSVSVDGDFAVVGAPGNDEAYVFEKKVTGWEIVAKLTASDGVAGNEFGHSVAISGDNVVVGAYKDEDFGSAYVFTKPPTGWADMTQTAKLTSFNYDVNDYFGYSVAISGDNIVIGAFGRNTLKGAVYVFEKPGTAWSDMTQTAILTASDGASTDRFGYSVSISGDNVVVGAHFDDDNGSESGSAYVFTKPGTGWANMTETAKLTASDGAGSDYFGVSVGISGDNVVVGAYQDDDKGFNSGSAYLFTKPGTGWADMTETAKFITSEIGILDYFGYSVSISDDNIFTGAYQDDDNGSESGSVFVFTKPSAGWANMTETKKIGLTTTSNTDDNYAYSVSVDGDFAVVGAYAYDNYKGCAYVLEKKPTGWEKVAMLTLSDANKNDYFGYSVGISCV